MLELQNLSFQVSDDGVGQKEIIKNINLTFEDHTFIAITGPNGGGKSTLVKLIMGIEKPTSGKILFNGTDITDKSITCCLCGKQALTLTARHLAHHEISVEDYKKLCGYEPTQKLMAREYLAKMTDNARRAQEARAAKRMEKEGQEG